MLDLEIPFAEEYLFEVDGRLSGNKGKVNVCNIATGSMIETEVKRFSFEEKPFCERISLEEYKRIAEVLTQTINESQGKYTDNEIEEITACKLKNLPLNFDKIDPDSAEEFLEILPKVEFVHDLLKGGYVREAKNSTIFINRKGEIPAWVKIVGLLTLLNAGLAYYYFVYEPEQIKKPYKQAGLTDEQASNFIKSYPQQNGNSTWVEFAKAWVENQPLASKSFDVFKNLNKTLSYIYFVELNGYDGLGFLVDCPKYVSEYQVILPVYSMNSSLVKVVLNQITRDFKVEDKLAFIRKVFPLYQSFGKEIQTLSQIYTLNNATLYFGSSKVLRENIQEENLLALLRMLKENDGINKDFDVRKHAILIRLAEYVPGILKYPKEAREGTIQIDDIGYKSKLVTPENEKRFWNVVKKAIEYIVNKIDRGEAKYDLDIPDKKLEAWYRRVRLLPRELFYIDIVSGKESKTNGGLVLSLDFGEKNTSPDERIGGKIPQDWLDEMAKRDFMEKKERYFLAIDEAIRGHPAFEWPNSDTAYRKIFGNTVKKDQVIIYFDGLMKEDEVAVFIQGYPRALRRGFIPWCMESIVPMEEPTAPRYSILVARVFGRAAFVAIDIYPNSGGSHDEPYVFISSELHEKLSQYGNLTFPYAFGWWLYKEELIKDHEGAKYRLGLEVETPSGGIEKVKLSP